jgi:hypothetical protein
MESLADLPNLPVGMIEPPRAVVWPLSGRHLPICREMAWDLMANAANKEIGRAFDDILQVLALSRSLRNKASLESYQLGVTIEKSVLKGLDGWLARRKPTSQELRRVLDELNRHGQQTPPPIDCLRTECFRSGGFLLNPSSLVLRAPGEAPRVPERWLTGAVALSLEVPWEQRRNERIWRLVWAGYFRAIEKPYWELPEHGDLNEIAIRPPSPEVSQIMRGWLPDATMSHETMIRLLDPSWLADPRLFCSMPELLEAATRSRCRVDSARLALGLSLYHLEEGKDARELNALMPKYFPSIPLDPYSGRSFGYRPAKGDQPACIWSTGPDRIDHDGLKDGAGLPHDAPQWRNGGFDLITWVDRWP